MSQNIGAYLQRNANTLGSKRAVVYPSGRDRYGRRSYNHLTFSQLENLSSRFAQLFCEKGIKKGDRVLVFIKPCLEFSALTFALFKIGAVPVFIDPGMGRKNLLDSISQTKPKALLAVPIVHWLKRIYPKAFSSIKLSFSLGWTPFPSTISVYEHPKFDWSQFRPIGLENDEDAAILFTSGGTGKPKGVLYNQEIFHAQIQNLQQMFGLGPNDIDLPGFPLFGLFTTAMGMTSCLPDMNPSKPSQVNPQKLVENLLDQGVSFAAGSPAIWSKVADYCLEHKIKLPALKYLVMFGAPVPVSLHRKYKKILTVGTTYTPYGATESLPVSNISGEYILDFTANHSEKGMGTCVGIAAPEIEIKILKTKDGELKIFSSDDECGQGDIGEIIVSGRVVTKKYDGLEEETAKAKTYDENGVLWHRMGDMGYLDGQNRLWFCGRKSHVVKWQGKDLYSIPTEAVFNKHPLVDRSALIATDDGPAVVFEKNKKLFKVNEKLQSELKKIADSASHTKSIDKFFVIDEFPVDVRHNIKIDRIKLSETIRDRQ